MSCFADYHMHSKYSGDSKNELESIVKKAISMSLTEIAITDHGPSHSGYGIKRQDYYTLRKEIDLLNAKYPQINILLGIEANILSNGTIDMDEELLALNDWLNAGYHFGSHLKKDLIWHVINFLSKFIKPLRRKAKKLNTEAMVSAMKNHNINMITHPGAKGLIDIDRIAQVAAETNTLLEINDQHGHLNVEELIIAKRYNVKFAVCSDSHTIDRIGNVSNALQRANDAGIPHERIVNLRSSI